MDFSGAGAVERVDDAFRARVHWRDQGERRNAHGPRRPDEEAAQKDLLQAAARCEQACFGGRVHGQDPCLHTLSKHCLSDVPPDRFSLAMYPLGGFAEAPLSSYLSDDFPLISRPRGLKRLLMYPSFSFLLGVIFWKFSAAKKIAPEGLF